MLWIALIVFTFSWHWKCLPAKGTRTSQFTVTEVNPFTNAIVVEAAPEGDLTRSAFRTAVPWWEKDLHDTARRNCDLWGMLVGYAVIMETRDSGTL